MSSSKTPLQDFRLRGLVAAAFEAPLSERKSVANEVYDFLMKRQGEFAYACPRDPKVLDAIRPSMDILENQAYHRRLLMYKGAVSPVEVLDTQTADATQLATQGYGVANYYFVTGNREKARDVFNRIVAGSGWNAFGYIAAEADLQRMPGR